MPSELPELIRHQDLHDIDWMACNRLIMYYDKTEIMPAEICCTKIFSDPADSTIPFSHKET